MIVIGVDPHKSTHTATALDSASNSDVGSLRIEASLAEYQRLDRLGENVARAHLGDRERRRARAPFGAVAAGAGRGRRGHSDDGDRTSPGTLPWWSPQKRPHRCRRGGQRRSAAGRCAAARYPETTADSLAFLDERRVNLSHSRTRTVDQLHALLRELMAGGAPTSLTPVSPTAALRGFRPRTGPDRTRVELAKELIADVRRFDEQLGANAAKMTVLLDEHGTRLREINGVGPVLAARLLGRTGSPKRFASAAAYANYTGTAPVQIASAVSSQHRLSRYGHRQLNSAIYTIAMIQIRMPTSTGRAYYNKKIAEGKPPRYATRALKRYLAAHLWRIMLADETHTTRTLSEGATTAS
jgi:transposase